jgi:hypothetical protein
VQVCVVWQKYARQKPAQGMRKEKNMPKESAEIKTKQKNISAPICIQYLYGSE